MKKRSNARFLEFRILNTNFAIAWEPGIIGVRVRARGQLIIVLGPLSLGWWRLAI